MGKVVDYLSEIDGLTIEELLALSGQLQSRINHKAALRELSQLVAAGQAELITVTRMNDHGYRQLRPAFRKKVADAICNGF